MNDFGLTKEQLALINQVFSQYPKIEKAVIFGSRAKGNFKKYSDIDIALFGDLTTQEVSRIELDLEALPIIYKFDVLSYNELDNLQLKEHINRIGKNITP
jgi:predicted nucleotidyltransferase